MRMNLKMTKKRKRKNITLIVIAIATMLVIASLTFIKYFSYRAIPTLLSYAESETKKLTILVINRAVTKQIGDLDTDELFNIVYNEAGEIQLIDFNSKNTSKILSTMTSLVELNLRLLEEGKIDMLELPENSLSSYDKSLLEKGIILEVPIGVVTDSAFLKNLGPKIPVKLSLVGDVVTGLTTEVKEYGINNALLKVNINIKVDTKIILPVVSEELTIDSSIPIAIKVIQGKIPDYYMNGFKAYSGIIGES